MPKEDAILSKKNKGNTIPSPPQKKFQIPSRPTKTALHVKYNWTRLCNPFAARSTKKRTPSLDPKKGFAAFRRRTLVPEKGVGIADVVPQAEQKRVEDKGGHDRERENRGAP